MKNLFLCVLVLLLGACSSTCFERVAVSKLTVTEIVTQANISYEGGIIGLSTYEQVDIATDKANAAIDAARPLCSMDEAKAKDYLSIARSFLIVSQDLMKGEENE